MSDEKPTVTRGPWRVIPDPLSRERYHIVNAEGIVIAANVGQNMPQRYFADDKMDADLIVAACNACQTINPTNPQAVAEALPELVAQLRLLVRWAEDQGEACTFAKIALRSAGIAC